MTYIIIWQNIIFFSKYVEIDELDRALICQPYHDQFNTNSSSLTCRKIESYLRTNGWNYDELVISWVDFIYLSIVDVDIYDNDGRHQLSWVELKYYFISSNIFFYEFENVFPKILFLSILCVYNSIRSKCISKLPLNRTRRNKKKYYVSFNVIMDMFVLFDFDMWICVRSFE